MTADTSHHSHDDADAASDGERASPAEHGHDELGGPVHTVTVQLPQPMAVEPGSAVTGSTAEPSRRVARRAIEGQRPFRHGGGAATLLVVRNGDRVELLPHACDTWAVTLDTAHALELRDALTELVDGVQP